jgi:hypothetical protein
MTGSGKSNFMTWLLERLDHSPHVIYDTKHDDKFLRLPRSRLVHSFDAIEDALDDLTADYIVFRPNIYDAHDPDVLDGMLVHHHLNWPEVGAVIDELYPFHSGGRAGPGLTALYTRGRSRGQTTIGGVQRPAWINRSAITEAQTINSFLLSDEDDRKTMGRIVPGLKHLPPPKPHHFYNYRIGDQAPRLIKPVPLVGGIDPGYTDKAPSEPNGEARTQSSIRHVWIGR